MIKSNFEAQDLLQKQENQLSGGNDYSDSALRNSAWIQQTKGHSAFAYIGLNKPIDQATYNGQKMPSINQRPETNIIDPKPKYLYQRYQDPNSRSQGNLHGPRPGQKSIRQLKDLAWLRFCQTLTNQPHLTNQMTQVQKAKNNMEEIQK
jgi:hypothetical protein